jgi:UDP-N-acetylglucosamine acyltransferase
VTSPVVHPSSIVHPDAQLGDGVVIGPFCSVAANVVVGDGTQLRSHVVLDDGARIGSDCVLYPGTVVGAPPQDLKYAGEPTVAIVGDRTTLRECVTINRGTTFSGQASVGSDCLIMAYVHVAHDCVVGNNVVIANGVQLGGHVEIGSWAIIGGLTGIHQFCRIGAHSMIGACSRVVKDVAPYALCGKEPLSVEGINAVGLRRRGFADETVRAIDEFYTVLLRSGLNTTDGLRAYESSYANPIPEVALVIDFIRSSKRGIYR